MSLFDSKIGYMCVRIFKRNEHIVEIEGSNNLAKTEADACSQQYYQSYLSITSKYRLSRHSCSPSPSSPSCSCSHSPLTL